LVLRGVEPVTRGLRVGVWIGIRGMRMRILHILFRLGEWTFLYEDFLWGVAD